MILIRRFKRRKQKIRQMILKRLSNKKIKKNKEQIYILFKINKYKKII